MYYIKFNYHNHETLLFLHALLTVPNYVGKHVAGKTDRPKLGVVKCEWQPESGDLM